MPLHLCLNDPYHQKYNKQQCIDPNNVNRNNIIFLLLALSAKPENKWTPYRYNQVGSRDNIRI